MHGDDAEGQVLPRDAAEALGFERAGEIGLGRKVPDAARQVGRAKTSSAWGVEAATLRPSGDEDDQRLFFAFGDSSAVRRQR